MPIDPVKVSLAMADGLSAVCSTCSKYWRARDVGVEGHQCLSTDSCGGPLAGDDFHEYEGPLTDLKQWCFVCGEKSKFGILVKGKNRLLGACEGHVGIVEKLRPTKSSGLAPVEIRGVNGVLPTGKLVQQPVRSLGAAIKEVEDYYAKKEGRDPVG